LSSVENTKNQGGGYKNVRTLPGLKMENTVKQKGTSHYGGPCKQNGGGQGERKVQLGRQWKGTATKN